MLLLLGTLSRLTEQNTVGLNLDSGSFTLNNINNTTPLASGDALQFGYYTNATAANPFVGTFIALTGSGGARPPIHLSRAGVAKSLRHETGKASAIWRVNLRHRKM